jgi:hypothetical protein
MVPYFRHFPFSQPKIIKPFKRFFKRISPKDFVYLFQGETTYAVSFILSFCPSKSFIRKVIKEFNNNEIAIMISDYLKDCGQIHFDASFTRTVEKYADKLIEKYKSGTYEGNFRKSISNILPKHIVAEKKYVEELKKETAQIVEAIHNIKDIIKDYVKKQESLSDNSVEKGLKQLSTVTQSKQVEDLLRDTFSTLGSKKK